MKKYDFFAWNRDFSHEIPQKCSHQPPLGAIFLSAHPLTWNPGSAPAIVFKHILFDETPLVPLVFLIHERKQAKCHDILFTFLKEKIPGIDKKQVPFVVDQEPGLKMAIQNNFPNCPIVVLLHFLQITITNYCRVLLLLFYLDTYHI